MSSRIIQKYINVNTKFRPYVKGEQAKSTDFLVSLPNPIRNVLSMKLKTFNAPNAEYTFDIKENNNKFEIIDVSAPNAPVAITIPPGSYTSDQLKVNVNSALTSAGFTNIQLDYITPIPPPSGGLGMFAFKSVAAPALNQYEFNFDVNVNNYIYETFGWKLGFRKSYYSANGEYQKNIPNQNCPQKFGNVGGLSVFNGTTYYLADCPIAMPNTSTYYLLSINDFLNQSDLTFHEACYPSNNIMDNIFARIDTRYSQDSNTMYETDTGEPFKRVYSGPVTLNKFHIKLYDDNNNILDLNNADYSFLLELEVKV